MQDFRHCKKESGAVQLGRQPKWAETRAKLCRRRAVSVYRTLNDAKHQLEAFPQTGKFIAKAVLSPDRGKMKHTPSQSMSSHTDWWCFVGINRHEGFEIVKE